MAQGGLHAFLHLGDRHLTRMDEMLQTQWRPLPLTLVTRHGIPPNSLVDDFVHHLCHCFRLPGKHRLKLLGDLRGLSVARMGESLQREFKGRTQRASRAGGGRDSGSTGVGIEAPEESWGPVLPHGSQQKRWQMPCVPSARLPPSSSWSFLHFLLPPSFCAT